MATLSVNMSSPSSTSYISASLATLSGASYGFSYGSKTSSTTLSGWLPGNNGVNSSAAVSKFAFTIPTTWTNVSMAITYYQNSEINYDYGLYSNLDTNLATSYSDTSTNVKTSAKGKGSSSSSGWGSAYTETYSSISTGSHYITFKYRKDTSTHTGADAMIVTAIVFTYTAAATYTITKNITNGTASGSTTIATGGTATITVTPSSGYKVPASINDFTVTNATKSSYSSGTLTISNPTGNVTVSATCPKALFEYVLNPIKSGLGKFIEYYPSTSSEHWSVSNCLGFYAYATTNTITMVKTGTTTKNQAFQYTLNNGLTWSSVTFGTAISVSPGTTIYFKGNNEKVSESTSVYISFSMTGLFNAYGSIMSLLDGDGSTNLDLTGKSYCFYKLFYQCTSLTMPPYMPATTLAPYCYNYMYYECTGLGTNNTNILPATVLPEGCYAFMFKGCTSLNSTMIINGTSMTGASTCQGMYQGCTSLSIVSELKAVPFTQNCYNSTFNGCTNLGVYSSSGTGHTNAWRIPMSGTSTGSYTSQGYMFYQCPGNYTTATSVALNTTFYIGSAPIPKSMPSKGDIINLNLDGTLRQYRVLKVNGTQAEVVAMFEANTSIAFNAEGENTYADNTLDIYLNTTWYNTLTDEAKAAIVDKTFTQDSWYYGTTGSPSYVGTYNSGSTTYNVSLGSTEYRTAITRHVYALSIQDVIDYLGVTSSMTSTDTTLTGANIWTMFWDTTTRPTTVTYPWLRSARASRSDRAWDVYGNRGSMYYDRADLTNAARPALTIDLSKISWS